MGIVGKEFVYANDAFLAITGFKTFASLGKIKPADAVRQQEAVYPGTQYAEEKASLKNMEVTWKRKTAKLLRRT